MAPMITLPRACTALFCDVQRFAGRLSGCSFVTQDVPENARWMDGHDAGRSGKR